MANHLKSRPDRIFISVDESSGRSTTSFFPAGCGDPIVHEDDNKGERAVRDAKAIVQAYPGSSIHGPHFHTARPANAKKRPGRGRPMKAATHE